MKDGLSGAGLIPDEVPACPQCGEREGIIAIICGLPNLDAIQLAQAGRLELGSRFFEEDAPNWRCKSCGAAFRARNLAG